MAIQGEELALACAKAADDIKAENIRVWDMRGVSSLTDFMVVCSGSSMPQLRAVLREVAGTVEELHGVKPTMTEGKADTKWETLLDIDQLAKRLSDEHLQGVAIAQVTPSPYRVSSRIGKELTDLLGQRPELEKRVSYAMMEGYIAARIISETLRRMGPRPPTREAFTAALDSLHNLDLGGYAVSYRGNRSGSRYVELSIVSSSGRIRQ